MQPIIIDRESIRTVIVDMLERYHDAENPIQVVWDTDDDYDYSRNEAGGGRVLLSVRSLGEVGQDRSDFNIVTDETEHTIVRRGVLSIKVESDVVEERDLAIDICSTIETRSFWESWRHRWYAAGLSILSGAPIQNTTTKWDERKLSFATLDLTFLTSITEVDDDKHSKEYITSVTTRYVAPTDTN